ncbi:MAG TPA: hypothetical protein VJ951_16075 [Bacteroidales bacterium]|nr:hypothetical protein [Bacteroidales bacterium]
MIKWLFNPRINFDVSVFSLVLLTSLLSHSCQGQTEQKREIERVIVPYNFKKWIITYAEDTRFSYNYYYTANWNNFEYPGYKYGEELLLSSQLARSNKYLKNHYINPEDGPVLSFEEQAQNTMPDHHERNFLQLIRRASFGFEKDVYITFQTLVYVDSVPTKNEVFLLKQLPDKTVKIATRLPEEGKHWLEFWTQMSLKHLQELEKRKEEKLTIDDPVFMEAYRASRAITNNGFDYNKLFDLIQQWKANGEQEKVDYFYQKEVVYHRLR